jgi:hypothetical protein
MASRSKPSVLKRQRERKKAEKAALKRETRARKEPSSSVSDSPVATREDLEGYGVVLSREGDLPPER